MSVPALYIAKEAEAAARPLTLFAITFYSKDGATVPTIYLTSGTDSYTNGVIFGGIGYASAVKDHRISGLGSQSSLGIDIFGQITLSLADADARWWSYELQYGFYGALLTADQIFFDAIGNTVSPDSKRIFSGTCDGATRTSPTITTLTANAKNTLAKVFLPPVPIQRTCPWTFPSNYLQRARGATNEYEGTFYKCGYSPDIAGGCGNYGPGGVPYTSCSYDVSACKARGMYTTDYRGQTTGHFGGIQWDPPATFKGKQYISGKQVNGVNNINVAKYSQYIPLPFGTCWVTAVAANIVGEPNSTRGEYVFSSANLTAPDGIYNNDILQVVVNGLLLPRADQTKDSLLNWRLWHDGFRTGFPTGGPIYESKGDPYGNIAMMIPTVYSSVASTSSPMSVQVLVNTRALPFFGANGQFLGKMRTDNFAWCLLELLKLLKPDLYELMDMTSVVAYAQVCAVLVSYTNLYGQVVSHPRFSMSLALQQRDSGANIINALKIAGRVLIVPNATGHSLRFVCKQTLCEQQPGLVAGSNCGTPVASFRATDNPAGSPTGAGYVAYLFNESNMVKGTLTVTQDGVDQTPVVVTAVINDADNDWIQDSVTVADPTAYDRAKQSNVSTLPVIGLPNYDQAYRVIEAYQAERFRGNPRADSGGTLVLSFQTTYRGLHLNIGDIVAVTNAQLQLGFQTYRVEGIAPTQDYLRTQLTVRWHEDAWYTDGYGQLASPYTATYLGSLYAARPPFAWQPSSVGNLPNDPLFSGGLGANVYYTFDIEVGAEQAPDNSVLPEFIVSGLQPINKPGTSGLSPRLARQGNQNTTGGNIPDGTTCYTYVTAIDAGGNESPIQQLPCLTPIAAAYGTNSISVPVLFWPLGTVSYKIYNGLTPNAPTYVGSGTGIPAAVSVTNYKVSATSPIDTNFDHFILRSKRLIKPGYLLLGPGTPSSPTIASNSIGGANIAFNYCLNLDSGQIYTPAPNELAGFYFMAVFETGGGDVPFINFRCTGNQGLNLYVDQTGGVVDTTTLNLSQIWFLVCHQVSYWDGAAVLGTAFNSIGSDTSPLIGAVVRVIAGPSAGESRTVIGTFGVGRILVDSPWPALNANSIFVIEERTWANSVTEPSVSNTQANVAIQMQSSFDNTDTQGWLVEAVTCTKDGVEALAGTNPIRLFFWLGQHGISLEQGLNILPNADLAIPGGPGTVVLGWAVTLNNLNAYNINTDNRPTYVYNGVNSFAFHWIYGYAYLAPQQSIGGIIEAVSTFPRPRRGESYFVKAAGRVDIYGTTLPQGVDIVYELRVVVVYTDGTLDSQPAGSPLINSGLWVVTSATLHMDSARVPSFLYATVAAYIANTANTPVAVMPPGSGFDVYVSSLSMVRVIDFGTEVVGTTLTGINGQGSIIPSQSVTINVTQCSNNGNGVCTITIGWPDTLMQLSDTSTFIVPAGSLTWNSLAVATYYFYPRVSASLQQTGAVLHTLHLASGDTNTPPMAPAQSWATACNFDGWYPCLPFHVSTPSTPSQTQPPGNPPDSCPEFNEECFVEGKGRTIMGAVQVGDLIKGIIWQTGDVVYNRVKSIKLQPSSTWRMVNGHRVSPTHPVSKMDARQWQMPYRIGTLDTTMGIAVSITLDIDHTRYDDQNIVLVDADGNDSLLMHNAIVSPC